MADGVVYAYANLGGIPTISLYALDASSGAFKWAYKTSYYPSYPVTVADGVVYAVGNREGPNASGILYALDAKTGALLCNSPLPGGHYYTSPPAVAGGLVYLGASDGVYALHADVETPWLGCMDVAWHYSTGQPLLSAVSSPPKVVNGMLYVGSNYGKISALDAQTGTLEWSYQTATGQAVWSTAVGGGMLYVGSADGYVYALDAGTGSLKWTYPKAPQTGESSPALFLAVDNGVVYVVPSGSSSTSAWNTVAALDAATGTLKWRSVTLGGNLHPPAVAGGIVYVSSYVSSCCSYLYALDAATGDLKWTYTRWGAYGFNDPPVVADGLVYVAKDGGLVYAFEAQPPPVSVSVPSYVPASFTVSWAVPTIWTGTAAASYDVQYRDGTTAAWTDLITATTTASTTFSGGPEGHTYYFRARASITTGAVGDWSDPVSITVDLTPPTGSLSISNGVTYATSITATLNVTATDATSGVADVSLSNDGSAWSSWDTYAPAKTWLLASGDGPKTVYGRFRDLASNVSAVYSDTIILDTAPPQTPTPDDGVAGVSSNPSLTFAWPATNDNFSGVDAYYWKTDCGLVTATTSLTATTSVLPDGQHTFYVRARDLAGNYSPYGKHTFTIKATSLDPPILNSPTSPTNREKINVSGTATGGATVRLYLNCVYYGETTSGSDGAWQFQDVPLAQGENVMMASVVDVGGGLSPISLPAVVVRREGQSTPPAPAAAALVGPGGGTVSSGNFAVEIPEGTLAGQTQVVLTPDGEIWPPCLSPALCKRFVGTFASITALERDSGAPAELLKAVRVGLPYNPQARGFIKPESLAVHYYDTGAATWVALPSQVDTANRRVIAEASHLTRFALLGDINSVVFIPVLTKSYAGW